MAEGLIAVWNDDELIKALDKDGDSVPVSVDRQHVEQMQGWRLNCEPDVA